MRIVATIQIHAARQAVWNHFAAIESWHEWNREVLACTWKTGKPWAEGATFAVEHHTLLGARRQTEYVVQMLVEGRSAIYSSTARFPVSMLSSVQLSDSLGGCRLEATHSYRGAALPLLWLLRTRQQAKLQQAMHALQAQVEGPRRL